MQTPRCRETALGEVHPITGAVIWPFCTPGAAMAGSSYITAEGPARIADAGTVERIQLWLGRLGHRDVVASARSPPAGWSSSMERWG